MIGVIYDKVINENKGKGNNTVLSTLGGPGTGKTSTLQTIEGDFPIIIDAIGSNEVFVRKQIKTAIDNGYKMRVVYTYRSPKDAWENGVLNRERHVPVESFIAGHKGARDTFLKVYEELNANPNIEFNAYANETGKIPTPVKIDFIRNREYDHNKIRQEIAESTTRHYEAKDKEGLTAEKFRKIKSELRERSILSSTQKSGKESSKDKVVSKKFDKKGREIDDSKPKNVFNTNESRAVQKVVADQLAKISATAKSAQELKKRATIVIDRAIENAGNERYALSCCCTPAAPAATASA